MNIALLCNSNAWGGLEINLYKLALWLNEEGHETLLICPAGSRVENECKEAGIIVDNIYTPYKHTNIKAVFQLKKILKDHNSKALIIGYSKDILFSVLANLLPGYHFKTIYLQQMMIGVSKKDIIHTFIYNKLNYWIAPSQFLKETVVNNTKIKKDKIIILPLGIELDKFLNVSETKEQLRNRFNIPQNVYLAGIIGRIDPTKGQDIFIEAIKILNQKGVYIHALIVGDNSNSAFPSFLPDLQLRIKEYGLEQQVHFIEFMKDVQLAFKVLDLYVMASTTESFGMVTVEAMISGVPVVGAEAAGTTSIIKDNSTGLFFENKNPASLAEKISRLKENPDFAKQLSEAALNYAKATYSHKALCNRIIALAE